MSNQPDTSPINQIWDDFLKNMPKSRSVFFNILTLIEDCLYGAKPLIEHLNISQEEYAAWESGESDSFMQLLPEIAAFYDVPMDYLQS